MLLYISLHQKTGIMILSHDLKYFSKIHYIYTAFIIIIILFFSNTSQNTNNQHAINHIENDYIKNIVNTPPFIPKNAITINHHSIIVKTNDTFISILSKQGISKAEINATLNQLKKIMDIDKQLRPGTSLLLTTMESAYNKKRLISLVMELKNNQEIRLLGSKTGSYKFSIEKNNVHTETRFIEGKIASNLYDSMRSNGIQQDTIISLIKLYRNKVDFQRDIVPDTKFQALIEQRYNDYGKPIGGGKVMHASLLNNKINLKFYYFKDDKNKIDGYFDIDGNSIERTLLKTPINGARISSGFGKRKHPTLGYSKLHKGVDFAAPIGTEIYAAGDGVIEMIGKNGSYGNYIKIKHDKTYSTAYAHINKFNTKLKKGSKVKQGSLIAYVGQTGRATGPHLHYEVILNNQNIDPMKIDHTPKAKIDLVHHKSFNDTVTEIEKVIVQLSEKNIIKYAMKYKQ